MKLRNFAQATVMVAFVAGVVGITSGASAAPVTFFGEDINLQGDPNTATPNNSTAARNNFFANLQGVGTETFENIAPGTFSPITLSFPGAGNATLNGSGSVQSGADGAGRFPISGSNYYNAGSNDFSISFSQGIAAFGFYGTDIGDFGGQLTLTLTDTLGKISVLTVPNTVGSGGSTSGSVLYFGFYDTGTQYTQIAFGNNSGGQDIFGFDDMSVGSVGQVVPTVPLPSSLPMFAAAMLALGAAGYGLRRRTGAVG